LRTILRVNRGANRLEQLAICLHRHHVTRDVQADVSPCTMVGKCDRPIRQAFGHIAISIVPVADGAAATHARDILQDLTMLDCITIDCLDLRPTVSGE
jgi:hypothetical protein